MNRVWKQLAVVPFLPFANKTQKAWDLSQAFFVFSRLRTEQFH